MTSGERLLIAFGAFVGGIAVGMLLAPESVQTIRRGVGSRARRSSDWLGEQVKSTQQSILDAGDEAATHFKKAAEKTVGRYMPDIAGNDEAWQDVYSKTVKDVEDEKR